MGSFYDSIPENIIEWIKRQHLFFVGTSPLEADGRVNVSPKEMEGLFEIINPNKVWYQDLTGSGIETISHLNQPSNGRMTIMFVQIEEGGPRIVRLFGTGRVIERNEDEFEQFLPKGDSRIRPGCRAVIVMDIDKVGSSCGYSMPIFTYSRPRPILDDWSRKKLRKDMGFIGEDDGDDDGDTPTPSFSGPIQPGGLRSYWQEKNKESVHSGLPGLTHLVDQNAPIAGNSNGKIWSSQEGKSGVVTLEASRKQTSLAVRQALNDTRYWDVGLMFSSLILGIAIGASCVGFIVDLLNSAMGERGLSQG